MIKLRGLRETSPERAVCLTFDDGYFSFYDEVLPILLEREIPATLFVISDFVGRSNKWDVTFGVNRRRHLSWKQIREIACRGVEIGSHGKTHRDLTRLHIAAVQRELQDSKKALEDKLGKAITALALPFGAVTLEIFLAARKAGYQEICGGVPGLYGPFPGVLPRMPVYRWDGTQALRRKLEMNIWESLRLKLLQNCSRGTRILKRLQQMHD